VHNPRIQIINIKTFLTHIPFGTEEYYTYDLREPKRKIMNPDKIKETRKTVTTTADWSNIPYYPTNREKRENIAKYLIKTGRPVPKELLMQIQEDKRKEIEEDSYNNFGKSNGDEEKQEQQHKQEKRQTQNIVAPPQPQIYQQHIQNGHISKIPVHMQNPRPPPNKFSPQYAAYIGAKPRAQASARVGLGGVMKN
jgi:hypothetical protein